jgi:hypothetical protein
MHIYYIYYIYCPFAHLVLPRRNVHTRHTSSCSRGDRATSVVFTYIQGAHTYIHGGEVHKTQGTGGVVQELSFRHKDKKCTRTHLLSAFVLYRY